MGKGKKFFPSCWCFCWRKKKTSCWKLFLFCLNNEKMKNKKKERAQSSTFALLVCEWEKASFFIFWRWCWENLTVHYERTDVVGDSRHIIYKNDQNFDGKFVFFLFCCQFIDWKRENQENAFRCVSYLCNFDNFKHESNLIGYRLLSLSLTYTLPLSLSYSVSSSSLDWIVLLVCDSKLFYGVVKLWIVSVFTAKRRRRREREWVRKRDFILFMLLIHDDYDKQREK